MMAVWWFSEALPMAATALIPAASFPLLGIAPAGPTSQAYMSPIITLLLGGFLLALAVERCGVHRRLALHVLKWAGGSPRGLVFGFATAAALLSMAISNTATTLLMMPIALALAGREEEGNRVTMAVLLATAYGASVGGMATPVGTPPNLIAISALERAFPEGPALTFLGWSARALPAVALILPGLALILTRVYPRVPKDLNLGAGETIRRELAALGPWRPSEVRALALFGLAGVLWVTRPDLQIQEGLVLEGWASRLGLEGTHDGTVAMLCVLFGFLLPDGDGGRILDGDSVSRAPWGLVLFFGGGVALSVGFAETGLSGALGEALASMGLGWLAFVAVVCLSATVGTEMISNTALANIAMPIIAATAPALQVDPRLLLVPVAMACSCAFMMPVATGPNAIAFGTGRLRVPDMVRAGLPINLMAWGVIVAHTALWGRMFAQ